MSKILGPDATLGVACFGITHPHTSGRVRAVQRLANARMMGAWDDSPLLQPFWFDQVKTAYPLCRCDGFR